MSKRLIVCSDGTWNTPDQKDGGEYRPSNVVKMARAIMPLGSDNWPQIVLYDKGVGTAWGLDRWIGGAFGKGLSKNVEDGYRFLVHNYEKGDQIFLFGFSRGAYTARSLAGLIRNCGLLKKIHCDKFPAAYGLYRSRDNKPDSKPAIEFIEKFSRKINVYFIGVWDTVGALGIPIRGLSRMFGKKLFGNRHQFHDVELSRSIEHAYHAIAIDEKRRPFKPTLWTTKQAANQTVEQVWFAGVHSNIGGGYKDSGLSDITFKWMMDNARECGLTFNQEYIESAIAEDYAGEIRNSRKGFYRLSPSFKRPIGKHDQSCESVHQKAIMRNQNKGLNYHPENLIEYLETQDQ